MAITFKEFESKAQQAHAHPHSGVNPREYALTGLVEAAGKFNKVLEANLSAENLSPEDRQKAIDNAWKLLWFLSVACNSAKISLEEAAQAGITNLDNIGDDLLP